MFGTKKSGFTFLELMVVMAIFAILTTIIIPQLGQGNARKQREQFVLNFNALLRRAVTEALVTNKIYKVIIDMVKRQITLQQQSTSSSKRPYMQASVPIPLGYTIHNLIIDGFDEMSRFSGGVTTTVWFYIVPQGLAQSVTINVTDRTQKHRTQDQQFGLVLNPFTAQFRMYNAWQQ